MIRIRSAAPALLAAVLLAVPFPAAGQQTETGHSLLAGSDLPADYVPEFGTMWTFDAPPLAYWETRYGFTPDQAWLDHLRLAAVRLPGCSSSFVSEDGLIMTNHHCARGCVARVSPPDTNYLRTGFVAASAEQEKVCPGMYVDQLVGMEDVTTRIRSAVTAAEPDAQVAQRETAIDALEAECGEETGMRCQVVAFYNGGMYSLYTYRRFDDVRLAFAPELEAAHFGGDPDNFTYPRFALDVSFLRVYEDGEAVEPEHWLEWSDAGPVEGEVTFVVGNPGSTGRLLTLAQMEYLRDVSYPAYLEQLEARLEILRDLSAEDPAFARENETAILGAENGFKAIRGYLTGLLDPSIMSRKAAFEDDFRDRVLGDRELRAEYGNPWDGIADAQLELATFATPRRYYAMDGATLPGYAMTVVRYLRQTQLPEDERLAAFRSDRLERVHQQLLRERPIDPRLETRQLAAWLAFAQRDLGADDPLLRTLLDGRTPDAAAAALVETSRLDDVEFRRMLLDGEIPLEDCGDPLVTAAMRFEPTATSYDRRAAELNAVISAHSEKLGEAIYAAYGKALPPDATFTLRISDGVVTGFPMNGTIAPYKTVFYGLYARAESFDHEPPFELAPAWEAARGTVDMTTPMNFVATNDIIGGNSGSPVVNAAGEVVGVVFDGNIQMLPNRFIFTDEISRSVSVHSAGIMEALRSVYEAGHIVDEIQR